MADAVRAVSHESRWFGEDDLLPISALQHLVFCERQCALIHIERMWSDNSLTVEGTHLHARVDERGSRRETRGDVIIARGLPLRSLRLGLGGRADVVEFHRCADNFRPPGGADGLAAAVTLAGASGLWVPFPVDYKRGKPKSDLSDEIQICAQALCLEEMLGGGVPRAALFYGRLQHRHDVLVDQNLRAATEAAAARLRELIRQGVTPRAVREPKCKRCSLLGICRPEAMSRGRSARRYLAESLRRALDQGLVSR